MSSTKYDLKTRDPISSNFAYEAFSRSGFKPLSAICEILDNSIEANCNEIIIKFEWGQKGPTRSYRPVKKFIFIDDGEGMNSDQVYDYFVATESDRREKEKGIGKFGVGAYMSGISQAKKCEVYSKVKGGSWHYTNLFKGEQIPQPIIKDPSKEYLHFDHGTIIIWSETYSTFSENDIDNDETGENLAFELGRIYRKFITDKKIEKAELVDNQNKIKIKIESNKNTIEVNPYDPTFITCNPKHGDKEPRMVGQSNIKIKTPDNQGIMHIVYSFFPEEWWIQSKKAGNKLENTKERKINGPGISIVREGRELYYGIYPGGPIKIRGVSEAEDEGSTLGAIDRWLGIEVSFDRDSDDIFGIEFNKSRIIMEKIARDAISETISPSVKSHRRNYTTRRKEYDGENNGPNPPPTRIHDKIPKPKYSTEDEKRIKEFAEKYKDDFENIEDVYQNLLKGYHVSLKYKLSPSGPFVEFAYEGESVLVMYNMQHPFMAQFFNMLDNLGQKLGADPGKSMGIPELIQLRELFDVVMAAYGFAQTRFNDIQKQEIIETTLTDLTTYWGNSANTLSKEKLVR